MAMLADLGWRCASGRCRSRFPNPIRFDDDTDAPLLRSASPNASGAILRQCDRVLTSRRCAFIGKCSPVHFFWGSFDLAVTRFSGRPAPPREGPAFMREAYSHEVISHGFWPGNEPLPEPVFYAYAVPEPVGFKEATVAPPAASYNREMGEFLLPVRAYGRQTIPTPHLASSSTAPMRQGRRSRELGSGVVGEITSRREMQNANKPS